jgi:alpha-galactosidase/6-phospho-beta-glucosidase family protein
MIAAGSMGFTRRLMGGIPAVPELADAVFAMTDVSAQNLER